MQVVLGVLDGLARVADGLGLIETRLDIRDNGPARVAAQIDFLEREEVGCACHIALDAGNGRRASDCKEGVGLAMPRRPARS